MCSRFALKSPAAALAALLKAEKAVEWLPRYNVAPSQKIPAVFHQPGKKVREMRLLQWGFTASWIQANRSLVNLRSEDISERSDVHEMFRKGRCLIPADGFYEWKHAGRETRPWYFRLKKDRPFAFAGLWIPEDREGVAGSCAILTTHPNEVVRPIHDRMPVILDEADHGKWLDGVVRDPKELEKLLKAYPSDRMEGYQVGPRVNNVRNDDAACLEPSDEPESLDLPF